MKLSIITINYNDKNGLEKTIKSVISQSFKDFQYIVIDGGSDDGSKDVIETYKKDLDVAISEKDSGIYNAMNKGASYAKGEYLLFLNSGDELYDDTVLSQVFSNQLSTDIVSCQCLDYNEKHKWLKTPPKHISLYTFVGGSLPHPSTFIKKDLLDKLGGYIEKYKIISDWCFFIDALLIERCSYSTLPITTTKFNCYGISSTNTSLDINACQEFLYERFGRIMDDYASLEDEAICNCLYWLTSKKGTMKKIMSTPFKVFNHIINGRNCLSRRIGIKRQ